jgi:hypothetical protein
MFRRAPDRWLAAAILTLAVAPAWAASTPIYKCLDNHLGLVYTDVPCKDGERLDIRAGDADPAAIARLDRALDRLDESAAQRMLDDRRAADARAPAAYVPQEPQDDSGANQYVGYGYGYGGYGYWSYPPYVRHHLHRPKPERPHMAHRTVPVTPRNPRLAAVGR